MRLWFITALIILLNSVYVYGLVINEIMYNPLDSDTYHEWIELYNNDTETYNLTGWKLRTESTDHSLNIPPENGGQGTMLLQPGSYLVIVQNAATFLNDYANYTGTVIDSSWSDLSNSAGKIVVIKNSSTVFDNVTYVTNASEGNTFCRLGNECTPTPGKLNTVLNVTNNTTNLTDVRLEIYINSAKVNITYTNLFKISIDNKTCSQLDNVTVEYNITPLISSSFTREVGCENYTSTGSWTSGVSGNYTICGTITSSTTNNTNTTNDIACKIIEATDTPPLSCSLSVNLLSPDVVDSSQTLNYDIFVNDSLCNQTSHDMVVEYWIEDMFGYYVKERVNTTQAVVCSKTINRQWTPDDISGTEGYKIFTKLTSPGCSDASQSDDKSEKIIVVRGTRQQDSSLEITSISNNEAKYGEDVNVNLYVFRNSTSKYSVDIWIRKNENKLSEVTTFHAKSKNTKYNLTLPVRIKPNCDSTYEDDTYIVFAEGLDKNSTRNITIKGISSAFCKTVQVSSGGSGSSGSATTAVASHSPMELISYPETVYIGKEFEITIKVNSSVKKPFSIYSYVYKGNNPVSEGGWTPNRKEVTENLPEIRLKNTVEKDTEPGTYNLRIRLKTDKEEDITKEVYVVQEPVKTVNNNINITSNNETLSSQKENKSSVTGLIVSKNSDIKKYAVIIYLLSKIKLPRLF
ncbi:MAG TPA: lamin tail domain-containing protein [Candidatus Aenigmarchaeota archaeon]|nr:lamin tail domain-containing protein [Candidatus Aenigmarchaeota archaeon]